MSEFLSIGHLFFICHQSTLSIATHTFIFANVGKILALS